jgi:hypothetical protein
VTVVRHFQPYSMIAFEHYSFEVPPLDEKGVARPQLCAD